jgi:hypothetical protein
MPLKSVRTRASPGPKTGSGASRSSATPGPAYQSARAVRTSLLGLVAIMVAIM